MVVSVRVAIAGIFLAYKMYWSKPEGDIAAQRGLARACIVLLYNKYFVDEIYNATVVERHARRRSSALMRSTPTSSTAS